MLGGYSAGVTDATEAKGQAVALGLWPRPITFSADFDVSPAQQDSVNAYLQGAASVLGSGNVGIYGGYSAVARALNAGVCSLAWQTFAWSSNQWDERAVLRQVPGGTNDYDLDEGIGNFEAAFSGVPKYNSALLMLGTN